MSDKEERPERARKRRRRAAETDEALRRLWNELEARPAPEPLVDLLDDLERAERDPPE